MLKVEIKSKEMADIIEKPFAKDMKTISLMMNNNSKKKDSIIQRKKNSIFARNPFSNSSTIFNIFISFKTSNFFEYFSYFIIILDTLFLSIDNSNISKESLKKLNILDFCCLLIFFMEIIVRISIELKAFLKNFLNLIDIVLFFLNMTSLIYLKSFGYDIFGDENIKFYNMIRCFQIMRIYRLIVAKKIWIGIATLAIEMSKIIRKLSNFLIILTIFLLIMTLIGKDVFSSQKMQNTDNPIINEEIQRMNFLTFSRSLMSNFMIFFDEDWHALMINHMKSYGTANYLYFIINIYISTMFLNKIFLALLINKLIESREMRNMIKNSSTFHRFLLRIKNIIFNMKILKKICYINTFMQKFIKRINIKNHENIKTKGFFFRIQLLSKEIINNHHTAFFSERNN